MSAYTECSQLTGGGGETVRMDLTVENRGRRDERVGETRERRAMKMARVDFMRFSFVYSLSWYFLRLIF